MPAGDVIRRARGEQHGDRLADDLLVSRALRERQTVTGTVIFSRERLLAEGADLADRARFELVPTPAARPTPDTVRYDGMVVAAVVPVLDAQGQLRALLYGGNLLNRRYEIVDAIKKEVFPQEVYRGKDIGTVTIFQGDLRISTNVTMDDGSRAVGTRLSESVCEAVLDRGGTWAGSGLRRQRLVHHGLRADPRPGRAGHRRALRRAAASSVYPSAERHQRGLPGHRARRRRWPAWSCCCWPIDLVLSPIRHVVAMAQKIIGGDLSARVGIRPPGEMGVLCRAVDSMAQAVAEREELLKLATRQQISRSEQLASVGRLAAGVAHEINNPLTGVLAFADMMREKENLDDQDRQDLELIIRETKRVREIVRGLLDFARETPFVQKPLDINELVRQTLRLLGKREAFQNIYMVEDLAEDLPLVNVDKNQLQQVFLNLTLNACEAMPEGGTLMVSSSVAGERVVVKVTDTGCGIKREHLDKIFEPFFTTKPVGKGTGLGLSVSYGILQQHGGTLGSGERSGQGNHLYRHLAGGAFGEVESPFVGCRRRAHLQSPAFPKKPGFWTATAGRVRTTA